MSTAQYGMWECLRIWLFGRRKLFCRLGLRFAFKSHQSASSWQGQPWGAFLDGWPMLLEFYPLERLASSNPLKTKPTSKNMKENLVMSSMNNHGMYWSEFQNFWDKYGIWTSISWLFPLSTKVQITFHCIVWEPKAHKYMINSHK